MEVYHNGAWGTVCNTSWTFENAFVACRTAGFNSAVRGLSDASTYFGPGTGSVLLDNVQCTGNEIALWDCPRTPWGSYNSRCSNHMYDAGVVCSDGEETSIQLTPLNNLVLNSSVGSGSGIPCSC